MRDRHGHHTRVPAPWNPCVDLEEGMGAPRGSATIYPLAANAMGSISKADALED